MSGLATFPPEFGPITRVPAPPSGIRNVIIASRAAKISQLIGDRDPQYDAPTQNLTASRYRLAASDLGVPFWHDGRTYLLFGDTIGGPGGHAIGYTTDTTAEKGLHLEFLHDGAGDYHPVIIPGISHGEFEVPMEGVSVDGRMYVYNTTDALHGDGWAEMHRSVVAVSDDDGYSFKYLYDLSRQYFINVSATQVEAEDVQGLPQDKGAGLILFGSGQYRKSDVYLAFQPSAEIATPASLRYWTGLDGAGKPTWGLVERTAQPLFDQPCVGEFSVSYNAFIGKWIMLYNCDTPDRRGINLRTADQPWGPWTEPQILFDPWADQGYCGFMHVSWQFRQCDNLQAPGLENVWGGEYGPYQLSQFATGDLSNTTIYFTLSTWNPYTVVLMKAKLHAQ
ncbi:MAG: DUF4185 domain-containing protein [Chloroflexi bacterium]|nr:DUF4185 domain-containing protein [Chloroflexota bacterium]